MTTKTKNTARRLIDAFGPQTFRLTKILKPIQPEPYEVEETAEDGTVITTTVTPEQEYLPEDAWIDLVGTNSKEFLEATKVKLKKDQERAENNTKPELGEVRDEQIAVVAACVAGWNEDFFGYFAPEEVFDLLQNPGYDWLRVQIEATLGNKANFFKK